MSLGRIGVGEIVIEEEESYAHVGLYAELKRVAAAARLTFLAPDRGALAWDRAAFLNLTYWSPGTADVLTDRALPADVLMHVAWHHLAERNVAASVEADLLGESIASAFDLYLVGRLLGHVPDAGFLESQVPRMTEAAEAAGASDAEIAALLAHAAEQPEGAFEEVRALLFDVTTELAAAETPERAERILVSHEGRRFAPLLHHFELGTWVLRAKLARAEQRTGDDGASARAVDQQLRGASDAVAWLTERWVLPALEPKHDPTRDVDLR